MKKPIALKPYMAIPKEVELFGRKIKTVDESMKMNLQNMFGQARYGVNEIVISRSIANDKVSDDELKLTYLHEMLHFILNFTGYENAILKNKEIDLEQFVELMSSAIYQYEKTAKY
jgi:Zn-dependent peptidase ImmA (M78 family)